MSKQFMAILGVLILGFVGFIVFAGKDTKTVTNDKGEKSTVTTSEHTLGKGTKKVTLLEYGDFQCPSCGQYFSITQEVIKKYGDQITFQFRNFPIPEIHPNAMAAHRAAEAAAKQDKFWEMHDMIYERQQLWSNSKNPVQMMEDYATELGLNIEQFKKDYQSAEVNAIINADLEAGKEKKVKGTPTFFLNGEEIDLSKLANVDDFNKLIDETIKKANN